MNDEQVHTGLEFLVYLPPFRRNSLLKWATCCSPNSWKIHY